MFGKGRLFRPLNATFLVAVLTPITPALSTAQQTYTIQGNRVAVYNLAGQIIITRGSGSDVTVQVDPSGRDAAQLNIEVGEVCDLNALRVIYPDDDIVYSDMSGSYSANLDIRHDGTFYGHSDWHRGHSWGCRNRRGDRVRIRSRGRGVEAWADLRISVPDGKTVEVYLVAGTITASNLNSDLIIDAGTVEVDVSAINGDVLVDTGSGDVSVTDVTGAVAVDTGSGHVTVSSVSGEYAILDTGSGSVTGGDISVSQLNVDTGSGEVDLDNVSAPDVVIDTGSGSVDLILVTEVDRLFIDTGSGAVDVTLPENTNAFLEIDTGSGGIEVDFPVSVRRWERSHITGTIGDGGGEVTIDTGSGGVTLRSS